MLSKPSGTDIADKFDGNFRLLARCDVGGLKTAVNGLSETDWDAVDYRQKSYEAHRHTQTIELIFDKDFRHEAPTERPMYEAIGGAALLAPFVEAIGDYYGAGYVIRALLVRLRPGGVIPPHVDAGYSLMNSHRVHIPVTSNDEVAFLVGGETRVMEEGELWEINNARVHAVRNGSQRGRVHLIVDWVVS